MKVLYVEDEEFLGRIVKETLETRGYTIAMETDGGNVMQRYIDFMPDVCVLDIMLPNKSGFEIAKEIRDNKFDTPIIFLTAKTQTEDVIKGFKTGANDYIRKPFSVEELMIRIENVTKFNTSKVSSNENIITFGEYKLYTNKQIIEINNEQRKLSYRETVLIKFLYDNKNTIVNRASVLLHIWGNDSSFNSRNLDVYITKLRSYLKDDSNLEILTIKGIGYRFVV
ncbi:MAG: response regulator transcription factor [Bacteroidetes bacterium]|jgi:DNA-binding response OmpR family regulator|nr:response regulator transcription factor [Bacteroidota bacterium]